MMDIIDQELKRLNDKAYSLYSNRADIDEWLKGFNLAELILLWNNFCQITDTRPYGASYDDEVYDSIYLYEQSKAVHS